MKSNKYVNEKINLTTLTPLFIGNDQASELSPVTDFIVKGDKAYLINQTKLEDLLSKDLELLNEYVTSIKQNNFDLEFFISQKLGTDVNELSKYSLEVQGFLGKNSIKMFINSVGKPFIPGSTIKGAIRTAVIYNWLLEHNDGQNLCKRILNLDLEIERLAKEKVKVRDTRKKRDIERRISDIRFFIEKKDEIILPKNKKYLSVEEKKKLRKIDKSKRIYNSIYNDLKNFVTKNSGHDFRHIQISDTPLLDIEQTKVIKLLREYVINEKNKTSQWSQVLNEKITTDFNLKIEKEFKDRFLLSLNNSPIKETFKMLNKFAIDFIDFELDRFNEFIKSAKKDKAEIKEKLDGIIDFYNDLKQKVQNSNDEWALVRIGGGKTYFDNSIGLALYKTDKNKFKQFRKLLGFWKHRSGGFVEEDSPITRTFYHDNYSNKNLPLGWTVIYFEKDKDDVMKLFNFEEIQNNKVEQLQTESHENQSGELDLSKLSNLGRITKSKKTN